MLKLLVNDGLRFGLPTVMFIGSELSVISSMLSIEGCAVRPRYLNRN